MADVRSSPDGMTKYILSTYDIHHFTYGDTDIYYKKSDAVDAYEWDVRVDEPDVSVNGDRLYLLRPVIIRCKNDVYFDTMVKKGLMGSFLEEAIIIAGLKKKGLLY